MKTTTYLNIYGVVSHIPKFGDMSHCCIFDTWIIDWSFNHNAIWRRKLSVKYPLTIQINEELHLLSFALFLKWNYRQSNRWWIYYAIDKDFTYLSTCHQCIVFWFWSKTNSTNCYSSSIRFIFLYKVFPSCHFIFFQIYLLPSTQCNYSLLFYAC